MAAAGVSFAAEPPPLGRVEARSAGGSLCGIVQRGSSRLEVRIGDFEASDLEEDMIALALPWGGPGKGAALDFETLSVLDRLTGEVIETDPRHPPESPAELRSFVQWVSRNLSLKEGGFIGDAHVQSLVWTAPPKAQRYRAKEMLAALTLPRPASPPVADKRRLAPRQRERLERLVANPGWIDASRVPEPPLAGDIYHDWEFHRTRGADAADWRRFFVREEQVAAIGRDWLEAAGLEGDKADPLRLRLFKEGAEVPTFELGDGRVAFLATPSQSPYCLPAAYWVDASGAKAPLRLEKPEPSPDTREWSRLERARQEFVIDRDEEFITSRDQFLTILDFRWIEKTIPPRTPVATEFDLPQFTPFGGPTTVKLGLYALTSRGDYTGQLAVSLNGRKIGDRYFNGRDYVEVPVEFPGELLKPTRNVLTIEDSLANGHKARLFLDRLLVTYERDLYADTSPYRFSALPDPRAGFREYVVKALASSGGDIFALDASDPDSPRLVETSVNAQTYETLVRPASGKGGDFIVFGDFDIVDAPEGQPANWDPKLREPGSTADHWIVYHPDFREGAERLAARRREEGHEVGLADATQIYTEFSYGQQTPEAIRAFFAWQMAHAEVLPASAVLIGDATHDYREEFDLGVKNYVPSFRQGEKPDSKEQFAVDILYSCVAGDDLLADFELSRLSVNNPADLAAILDKVFEYEDTPTLGPWRAEAGFIADAGGFSKQAEEMRLDRTPAAWTARSVYLEEFPWVDNFLFTKADRLRTRSKISPETTTAIREMFNEGLWSLTFWGHGSPNIWSTQRMWFGGDSPNSDNLLLTNAPRLPFVTNMTCNTGAIDYPQTPWNVCMTEDLMRQRRGGPLAVFAPGGMGFTTTHRKMATCLRAELFDPANRTVGDVATLARWRYGLFDYPDGILRMYILQGDVLSPIQRPKGRLPLEPAGRWLPPGSQGQTLRGLLPEKLRSGRFFLRATGPDRHEILRREGVLGQDLRLGRGGRWSVEFPVKNPLEGPYSATFYAWDEESGLDASGGTRWLVGAPKLEISALSLPQPEIANGEAASFRVRISNLSEVDALAVPVSLEEAPAFEAPSEKLWTTAAWLLVDVPAGETIERVVEAVPSLDVSVWRAKLGRHAARSGGAARPEEAPLADDAITASWKAGAKPPGIYLIPALSGFEAPPRERVPVARGRFGALLVPGNPRALAVEVKAAGGQTPQVFNFPARPEAAIVPASFSHRLDPEENLAKGADLEFRARVLDQNKAPFPEGGALSLTWRRELFPDLEIVSARFRPERPTEGETVFFEAEVANRGLFPAESVRLTPYPGDLDPDRLSPTLRLPDRSESPQDEILIPPGETRLLSARWDPSEVPPGGEVMLFADMGTRSHEPELANNRARLAVEFRSNFDLHFLGSPVVGIETLDASIPIVRLSCELENKGETAAERVEIHFHESVATLEDGADPIATRRFDRIGPGERVSASFDWSVPQHLARVGIRPVAVAQIKGSRQKVHSAPRE